MPINKQQVIQLRQKQREIQAVKDTMSKKLVDQAIDTLMLAKDAVKVADQVHAAEQKVVASNQVAIKARQDFEQVKRTNGTETDAYIAAERAVKNAELAKDQNKVALETLQAFQEKYEHFPEQYDRLNNPKKYAREGTRSQVRAKATEVIRRVVKEVTEKTEQDFEASLDRKALGFSENAAITVGTFAGIWAQVNAELTSDVAAKNTPKSALIQAMLDQPELVPPKELSRELLYLDPSQWWENFRYNRANKHQLQGQDKLFDAAEHPYLPMKWNSFQNAGHNLAAFLARAWNYRQPWKHADAKINTDPAHHTVVLKNIKLSIEQRQEAYLKKILPGERAPDYFDATFGRLFGTEAYKRRKGNQEKIKKFNAHLNDVYYEALIDYYERLRQVSSKPETSTSDARLSEIAEGKRLFNQALEFERSQYELANKKVEQQFLHGGDTIAKISGIAQGIFVGGAWLFLFISWNPILAIVGALLLPYLMFETSRSNYMTSNDEMGPLLKQLFFNPGHVFKSVGEKIYLWFRHSEFSWAAFVRTLKGQSNFIAASFIGVLTVVGGFELAKLIPKNWLPYLGEVAMGPLGVQVWPVVLASAALGAVSLLLYFVITNTYEMISNREQEKAEKEGRVYLADYNERLEKLKSINNVTTFLKSYTFGAAVAIFGIGATLVGAATVAEPLLALALPHGLPLGFTLGSLAITGVTTVALLMSFAVVAVAIRGISGFYKGRTRGSTEQLVSQKMGTTFDYFKDHKLRSLDATGRNAPDLESHAFETTDSILFTIHEDKVNAEQSRIVNAFNQAGPSVVGGIAFFTAVALGIAGITGGDLIVAGGIGLAAGAIAGLSAAWASYSANSTGNRQPQRNVTEVEMAKRDVAVLGEGLDLSSPYVKAAQAVEAANEYAAARARQGDHDGLSLFSHYNRDQKLDGAQLLEDSMKATVEGTEGTVRQPLFFKYADKPVAAQRVEGGTELGNAGEFDKHAEHESVYSNGRLGEIASKAAEARREIRSARGAA